MRDPDPFPAERRRLVRKLESIAQLSEDDRQALLALPMSVEEVGADQDIVRDGDRPAESFLLLEGFSCRYKLLPDGRRQIVSFNVPGDVPDLLSLHLRVLDHSIGTLVPSKLAFISHANLHDLIGRHPRIGAAFWRDTLIDAAIFREWMVGLGRRSAYQRVAHLFCELALRMEVVGLAYDRVYELPVTQAELGDALGLSTVHVNRMLQELRENGLIAVSGRTVRIQNWDGLKRAGGFDPLYLHLQHGVSA